MLAMTLLMTLPIGLARAVLYTLLLSCLALPWEEATEFQLLQLILTIKGSQFFAGIHTRARKGALNNPGRALCPLSDASSVRALARAWAGLLLLYQSFPFIASNFQENSDISD